MLHIFERPVRFFSFDGKGGVGKTSLACATAVGLADRGRGTLLVSTDPADRGVKGRITPEVNAAATVIFAVSVAVIVVWARLMREEAE